MKYFEANGRWFPAGDPEKAVGGTLRYSKEGFQLSLIGTFQNDWTSEVRRYPVIHGVVGKNPFGSYATLFDSHQQRISFGFTDLGEEHIKIGSALIGDDYADERPSGYPSVLFELTYLRDWLDRTGFEPTEFGKDHSVAIRYRTPSETRVDVGGKTLDVNVHWSSHQERSKYSIEEKSRIVIEGIDDLSVADVFKKYVRVFQNLLTFAADTPNGLDVVQYGGKVGEDYRSMYYLFEPIFRVEEREDYLTAENMLFTYPDAVDSGLEIFERWRLFAEKCPTFCTVYFATQYAPPRFLDEKFLGLMAAFTLLCSEIYGDSSGAEKEVREIRSVLALGRTPAALATLEHAIPTAGDLDLPARILAVLGEYQDLMGRLVGDPETFIASISGMIVHSQWRKKVENAGQIGGIEIHKAMEKIQILLKIMIMSELGFPKDAIIRLVRRNRRYSYLGIE